MNEEIRKIVNGYIGEGDYEKALSLLMNLPLEDDADKALLESCKKEFASSCTTAITDAVKSKDKQKAESVLSSYKRLIGDDANATLFQTLVDGIQEIDDPKQSGGIPGKSTISISGIFDNCTPDKKFLRSKVMWGAYALLALIAIVCGMSCKPNEALCIDSIILAISLAIPTIKGGNSRFKPVGLILLIIPIIATIAMYKVGLNQMCGLDEKIAFPTIPWIASFAYVIVYNVILKNKSWGFRVVSSILLLTILNPVWYGMNVFFSSIEPYTMEYGIMSYRFNSDANVYIIIAILLTLAVYYFSFAGFDFTKIWSKIKQNKKQIGIVSGSLVGLFIIFIVVMNIKESHDRKIAHQQAIEQARQDSIQDVEQARIAAIEQARQDSIAAVRRREQARRDSIDYAEHAGFVSKYATIGLIITNLEMTKGRNSDGVPTKGVKFTVFNPTHKTIKYVIVNAHAVNKFNDRVSYNERCRGMGPVDSHEYGSWDFNDLFTDKNDIIDDLSVSFQVEYTNGSSKTIRWKDAYVRDFKASWFNGR